MGRHLQNQTGAALSMVAPAMLGLLLFVALPFCLATLVSFTNLRLGSPLPVRWVGLDQYQNVLADTAFRRALWNNGLFALCVVPVQTSLALSAAVLLNRRLYGIAIFRTVCFLPLVFPMPLVAVVWELIYAPGSNGTLNSFLASISFGAWKPQPFLHHPSLALPAIMLLSIWQGMGFQMVLLLAGLQSIPQPLYEAAAIDGAGRLRRFWHVTLPGLRNPLIFVLLMTSILAFRVFDQVQILTRGGPQQATTTVIFETYTAAFERLQIGRACAMTVIFFLLVLLVTAAARLLLRQQGEIS